MRLSDEVWMRCARYKVIEGNIGSDQGFVKNSSVESYYCPDAAQYTAKEGPLRIQYKCLIWNLIYSQTKYEIDYKDYLFLFMICNFPYRNFVCWSFMCIWIWTASSFLDISIIRYDLYFLWKENKFQFWKYEDGGRIFNVAKLRDYYLQNLLILFPPFIVPWAECNSCLCTVM